MRACDKVVDREASTGKEGAREKPRDIEGLSSGQTKGPGCWRVPFGSLGNGRGNVRELRSGVIKVLIDVCEFVSFFLSLVLSLCFFVFHESLSTYRSRLRKGLQSGMIKFLVSIHVFNFFFSELRKGN